MSDFNNCDYGGSYGGLSAYPDPASCYYGYMPSDGASPQAGAAVSHGAPSINLDLSLCPGNMGQRPAHPSTPPQGGNAGAGPSRPTPSVHASVLASQQLARPSYPARPGSHAGAVGAVVSRPPIEASMAGAAGAVTAYKDKLQQVGKFARQLQLAAASQQHSEVPCNAFALITDHVKLYRENHLPAAKEFIVCLNRCVKDYQDLSFEIWVEHLGMFVKKADEYRRKALAVQGMHLEVRDKALQLSVRINKMAKGIEEAAEQHEAAAKQCAVKVQRHAHKGMKAWVGGNIAASTVGVFAALCFIIDPFITGPALAATAASLGVAGGVGNAHHAVKQQDTAFKLNQELQAAKGASWAAEQLKGPVTECAKAITDALGFAACFFSSVHAHVEEYHSISAEAAVAGEENAKLYFARVKAQAGRVTHACDIFLAALPAIESDLKCIEGK